MVTCISWENRELRRDEQRLNWDIRENRYASLRFNLEQQMFAFRFACNKTKYSDTPSDFLSVFIVVRCSYIFISCVKFVRMFYKI